ncbi:DUF4011 domain-containing protein [Pseudonocardia endophytica]|uniref:Uncharacterized protein DUF3320 n=1 Tax=Pseudonocardia endophytica TaxID=401976 RepID=A0A4R1HM30_PSEEN|nr:DUF4011 domain-containing protein [Pseudonocardia endophytica]TCK21370.1 uncharacterized protein DUF3320 [Pseudonocardia endophytica]
MTIDLEVRPVLSYAMAHNGIAVVTRIVVSPAPGDVQGARLQVQVSDATGPIGESQEVLLDLRAGDSAVLSDLRLALDPTAMLQVEEQRPGTVTARLDVDGQVWAEQVTAVQLLAAHQWTAGPVGLALEMLAAHVMPNHPAITALASEVADRLAATTGDPSLQGYQAGPERVDRIVDAVYEVMQARGIGYAEPPASWADEGQKVRTPGEVLDGRIGTCLDTVVTMAAVLEQAGVRPLLWVVEGHAFLGYWRDESSLATAAELDVAGAVNRVDLGEIALVETTSLTRGAHRVPVAEARRTPAALHLSGDLAHVVGIVDVHRARLDRVVPLPARSRDADGAVRVTTYTPAVHTPAAVPTSAPVGEPRRRTAPSEPPRVTRWKNALLDLSLRNRLIHFTERAGLELLLPDGGAAVIEDLLHQNTSVTLRASDEFAAVEGARGLRSARDLPQAVLQDLLHGKRSVHADVTGEAYPARMRGLAYKARTITEETGANNLYLALGTLVWDLDGRSLRSPLILVPVTLRAASRGGHYRLTLDEAGTSTPNYCLIEKLRQTHGLTIPGLAEPAEDGAGIDLDAAFDATRRTIAERGLAFRVEPTAHLAVLQFAKFRLWKDLDENWRAFASNPLVAHLLHTPTEAFADPVPAPVTSDLDGLDEDCPVPADASQLRAVSDAVAGRTFVLEGPPGTGKSQTITNLLAHAIAQGRRVLFVAEKRAALDVVQSRLDAVGLGPLSLDLHDKGSKPVAVKQQIAAALDLAVEADRAEHAGRVEELRAARRPLTRYAFGMSERNAADFSLYDARCAELAHDDADLIPVPLSVPSGTDSTGAARLREMFGALPAVVDVARPGPGHPWSFVDRPAAVDVAAAGYAAGRLDAVLGALPPVLAPGLDAARTPRELQLLADLVAAGVPLGVLDEVRSGRWNAAVDQVLGDVDRFRSEQHPGLDVLSPSALGLPVAEIDRAANEAAASGFFGRRKRVDAVRATLAPALRPGATVARKQLVVTTGALVTLRTRVDALAVDIVRIPGLELPAGWNPFDDAARADLHRRVERLRGLAAVVDPDGTVRERFREPLRRSLRAGVGADTRPVVEAASAASDLATACGVPPDSLGPWAGDDGLLRHWRRTGPRRGPCGPRMQSLRQWLDLLGAVDALRHNGMHATRSAVLAGGLDVDEARRSFELGLARASVDERLQTTGLDGFDRRAHERAVERFGVASTVVRRNLVSVLPHQVLAGREFDAGAVSGRVGELRRQLGSRRGKKIRELISAYGDLITRVLPCVLVSPDSLARFFPAVADQFDIVVFDEASQVRVADAVGAMGRGRSVVVVGDSKQMPPTAFAESSGVDDDPDAEPIEGAVEDEESILTECVQARVESQRLRWHYRSQDESLIAFSNHHYYAGDLSSFPAPSSVGAAVSLVRVDGTFHRSGKGPLLRTNPIEAQAVVAEIRRRFADSPDALPSIGVVTFNQQQRAYVEGLLRDLDDVRVAEALDDPDGLFVKNLENVQGDERDTILFSTAFSVNERGVLPSNFGPLNRAGGERRLNVAVTRARRQIVVFSSFDPEQMRTAETSSVGFRHLRTYLEMADRGPSALPADRRRRAVVDRHRDDVAEALRAAGLDVRCDVGLSDFTLDLVLERDGRPHVAVLLDGPGWSRRLTARDRDRLPREVLGDILGWPRVERVWLPEWLADKDSVVTRLMAVVRDNGPARSTVEPVPTSTPAPTVRPEVSRPEPEPRPSGAIPTLASSAPARPVMDATWPGDATEFVPWHGRRLGGRDVLDALPGRAAAAQVREALVAVVEAEGPIHFDRLARLVGQSFDLSKLHASRRDAILHQLPRGLRCDRVETVAWPATRDPETWTGYRPAPEGASRAIEDVPLREIVNAMAALARSTGGMELDELHRETLRVFGLKRRTGGAVERLNAAVALAENKERLRRTALGTVTAV